MQSLKQTQTQTQTQPPLPVCKFVYLFLSQTLFCNRNEPQMTLEGNLPEPAYACIACLYFCLPNFLSFCSVPMS